MVIASCFMQVPFFSDDEETPSTPKADALFMPRENPRALVIRPTEQSPMRASMEKTSPLKDTSTPAHENGKLLLHFVPSGFWCTWDVLEVFFVVFPKSDVFGGWNKARVEKNLCFLIDFDFRFISALVFFKLLCPPFGHVTSLFWCCYNLEHYLKILWAYN